jgi:hypothetical protein
VTKKCDRARSHRVESTRSERVASLCPLDHLLPQMVRPLPDTPRLQAQQRAEDPTMTLTRPD